MDERDRIAAAVGALPGRRLLVVGDLMLDRYLEGEVDRISPEAPVPVVRIVPGRERVIPGGAANVAANVRSLGGEVSVCGLVGDDEEGRALSALLEGSGIGCSGLVVDAARPTTTKTRVTCRNHQMLRIDRETPDEPGADVRTGLLDSALALVDVAEAVIIEDYDKGTIDRSLAGSLVARCLERGIPVAVDPKFRNFLSYAGCTLFKPNRQEASRILGIEIRDPSAAASAARDILGRLGAGAVLLTLGEQGSVLCTAAGGETYLPTAAHGVFDVSGAGDAVIAVMGLALAAGVTLEDAALAANFAAAAVCARPGVYAVRPRDIVEETRSLCTDG